MSEPTSDHPLAQSAQRAADAARARVRSLDERRARLRAGEASTIGDTVEAVGHSELARERANEANRALVTIRLARADYAVRGADMLTAARRVARLTLAEDVRRSPLDP